jgi:hypothetical protein
MLWARMVAYVTGTVNQELIGAMAMMIGLCFARIKSAFEMNNIQRGDVTL